MPYETLQHDGFAADNNKAIKVVAGATNWLGLTKTTCSPHEGDRGAVVTDEGTGSSDRSPQKVHEAREVAGGYGLELVAALNIAGIALIDHGGLRKAIARLNATAGRGVGVGDDTRGGKDRKNEDESGEGVSEHLGFLGEACRGGCVDDRTGLRSTAE